MRLGKGSKATFDSSGRELYRACSSNIFSSIGSSQTPCSAPPSAEFLTVSRQRLLDAPPPDVHQRPPVVAVGGPQGGEIPRRRLAGVWGWVHIRQLEDAGEQIDEDTADAPVEIGDRMLRAAIELASRNRRLYRLDARGQVRCQLGVAEDAERGVQVTGCGPRRSSSRSRMR